MLRFLELRDFALIERLELELAPGLNAFTGETGAGKSILVDALLQLAGNRADSGLIRAGCDTALVQAEFTGESRSLTLTRRLQTGSRSSARVDGEQVKLGELARTAAPVIAIHGQHAAIELADQSGHLHLLDRLLPEAAREQLGRHQELHAQWNGVTSELAALRDTVAERIRRLDTINWQLEEIRAARLEPGEEEELRATLGELRHADAVAAGGSEALARLTEADESAISALAAANRALDAAARHSSALQPLAEEIRQSLAAVQATASELEAFLADFTADPEQLERTESRLALLERLKRKYGTDADEILAYATLLEQEQQQLQEADDNIALLENRLAELATRLQESAAQLTVARQEAAGRLEHSLLAHLARLGMGESRFQVAFSQLPAPGRFGAEQVRFTFSANPGEPLRDLAEVASGGELSRLLLALNLVAGAEQPVLVFDEVDAGTGGKAALAIGNLLRQLAASRQVLVVTHLPQVAAFAHVQYHVSKQERGGRTLTSVARLDEAGRRDELARMLAGKSSEASLRAAAELLEQAADPVAGT